MASASPLPPPPAFKQQRAARTYDALLAAAATVFAERGFEGAQTPDIAAAAGVSTGALYRYFKDKRHLFIEMLRHHLAHARAEVAARLDPARFVGADACVAMDTVIDVLVDLARRNAALTRVYTAASLTDPDVARLRATTEAQDRAVLAQTIGALVPADVVPNPDAAAVIIQIAAIEVAVERAGVRPHAGPKVSDRDVKLALREMFHRYLLPGQVPSARPAGRTKK
jgi:AcrR family transcriptional regulator